MRMWKIVLVGTVLSTALIFTIVRHGSSASERTAGPAPVTRGAEHASVVTFPIVPADVNARDPRQGPVNSTDW